MKRAVRVVCLAVVFLSAATVGYSYATASTTGGSPGAAAQPANTTDGTPTPATGATETAASRSASGASESEEQLELERQFRYAANRTLIAEQWNTSTVSDAIADDERGLTVVATQGFYVSEERAELAAFTEDGRIVYYERDYRVYFDVDPVPEKRYTVEYVAARHLDGEACANVSSEECTRNVVVRVNLTTDEREVVYGKVTPRVYSARWHDVDRLNDTHLLVADIVTDSVYAVDTRDNSTVWRWNASENYTREAGGKEGDWTHVNDVEPLADGRVMVSLRNMDSTVFLEPAGGDMRMNDTWTLGEDGNHSILYEHHNPDYIPAEMGGPNVLVADSENGRIVEYHRADGEWNRTWTWRDARLQWPRDADRLPDGATLLVDSHGDRVLEVSPRDRVAWSAHIGMPYDVERLGTGDESAGGPAARFRGHAASGEWPPENGTRPLHNGSATDNASGASAGGGARLSVTDQFWIGLKDLVPSVVANGLLYVAPSWVRFSDLAFAAAAVGTALTWGLAEWHWSSLSVRRIGRGTYRRVRRAFERA